MKNLIDLQVEQFVVEVEMSERHANGEACDDLLAKWCQLSLAEYSGEQLLESVSRHVKALTDAEVSGELGAFDHALHMLNYLADEIERRMEHHDLQRSS